MFRRRSADMFKDRAPIWYLPKGSSEWLTGHVIEALNKDRTKYSVLVYAKAKQGPITADIGQLRLYYNRESMQVTFLNPENNQWTTGFIFQATDPDEAEFWIIVKDPKSGKSRRILVKTDDIEF